jgi:NAD(P)-dependent dehydrogenase (short-subunit alcohol dehydrogenase family)
MGLEPEWFPIWTLRRRAKTKISAPTESFKGKTVLITGASGSICSEAAKILIDLGVDKLIFGVRNVEKGKQVAHELTKDFKDGDGPKILVWSLELQSSVSVREFARRVATLQRLDNVLMGAATCNAERKISEEGWEKSELYLPTLDVYRIYNLGC